MLNPEVFTSKEAAKEAQLARDLEFLRVNYGIDLIISAPLTPEEVAVFRGQRMHLTPGKRGEFPLVERVILARRMVRELSKYPREYIEHARVKRVRVFRGLPGDVPLGLADLRSPEGTTYSSTRDGFTGIGIIHHEVWHQGEKTFKSRINKKMDDLWAEQVDQYDGKHNPVIEYLASTRMRQSEDSEDTYEFGPSEDRAHLAGEIMRNSPWLRADIHDRFIRMKAAWTLDAFQQWSGGLMDANYFLDLFKGKVGEDYWAQREVAAA